MVDGHLQQRFDPLAENALELSCEVGDDRNATWALEILADLARQAGTPDRAARLLDRSRRLWQARGVPASPTRQGERRALLDAVRADLADTWPRAP